MSLDVSENIRHLSGFLVWDLTVIDIASINKRPCNWDPTCLILIALTANFWRLGICRV
jgi:hypothetical protein